MRLKTRNLLIACLFTTVALPYTICWAESVQKAAETKEQRDARIAWWRQARFGMFIHWGPVSLKGTEISWSRANSNPECPNQGSIPAEVYDNLYKEFNPVEFDAKEWVAIAQASGMKYVVLTAKHCDGFCLWHSKAADYNISKTPFVRDVCAELAQAAHAAGIKLGWYYSPMDWRDPDCRAEHNARYVASMQGQLREILSNYGRIDLLWFDTDGRSAPWDRENTYGLVRRLQPQIIINNRLDMGSEADYEAQKIGPYADYYTPEQRIGEFDNRRPWETCMTLGTQWSWKPDDNIKSLKECVHTLVKCVGGDGNLLLNVGPMPNGRIEPRQVEVLNSVGKWLGRFGESIYGTRGGPFKPGRSIVSTNKGNVVYIHALDYGGGTIRLPALPRKIIESNVLTGGVVQVKQTETAVSLAVAKEDQQEIDTIIKLTLDGPAVQIPPVTIEE
ncbi:MAG: alpha-L-fucosidase [Sedimentisphaerales bacterium]|nr:alpha-L-fucosidase [Sedimentisphaerales bacterium]